MGAVAEVLEHDFPPCFEGVFDPAPYKVFRGGRGGARSWTVARALLLIGLDRPIRILCARETQKSIRESVHKLLVDQIARMGMTADYRVQHVAITGNQEWPAVDGKPLRTEFIFAGISDQTAAAIKSFEDVDYCWVEEAQTVTDHSWQILLPTLFRSKPGCEVWVTFNPELDTDPTWRRFVEHPPEGARQFVSNWRDNPWFPVELNRLRLHDGKTLPRYEYEWIWEGKCKPAVAGAIYADEVAQMYASKRICRVPYDPFHPVYPVADIGWNDSTSIGLWQRHLAEFRCIGFLENNRQKWDWYTAELRKKPYNWGRFFLPHDGGAATIRSGGRSDKDILEGLGWSVTVLERKDPEQGIRETRMAMAQMAIDESECKELIEHLRRYKRAIPPSTGEPGAPVHDAHSHAADMVRYAAQAMPDMTDMPNLNLPPMKFAKNL